MRRKAREIWIFLCLSRYRTGLDFFTSPDKKIPDLASTNFRIQSVFKNFHSGERIKKVADSYAGRIHRIRVDGNRIRKKEKVAD